MKKNKMLRMAAVIMVLTLLSTSIIGGTFAKYVTTDSAQDAARVAKFGVVATIAGDLFGSTYKAVEDDNVIMSYAVSGGTVSADAATAKVVAPGTQNKEGLSLTVTGTPEVSTQVLAGVATDVNGKSYVNSDIYLAKGQYGVMVQYTGALTAENVGNYYTKTADGKYVPATVGATDVYELRDVVDFTADADYYPLTWYVNNGEVQDQSKVQEAIVTAFNGKTGTPNVAYTLDPVTVGWAWDFSDVDSGVISDNDRKDTILGKMIAGAEDVVYITADSVVAVVYKDEAAGTDSANTVKNAYAGEGGAKVACLTVSFSTSLTVEQVD